MNGLKSLIGRLRGEKITVGLDIGHSGMRAVKIRHGGKKPELLQIVKLDFGTESPIVDGELRNPEVFKNALGGIVEELEVDGRYVQLIASFGKSTQVLTDHREYRVADNAEEFASIQSQIQSTGLFGDADLHTHFQVVSRKENGVKEVVMVAAKKRLVKIWEDAFRETKGGIHALDVDCMASFNALSLEELPEELPPVAILNLGAQHSYITFVVGGIYQSTRDLERVSLAAFDRIITAKASMSPQAAREKMFQSPAGDPILTGIYDSVRNILTQSINYFHNQSREKLAEIYICGGGANIPGLLDVVRGLHSWKNVKVMQGIENLPKAADVVLPDPSEYPLLSVAAGLALRRN